jgi:hypothetical protein
MFWDKVCRMITIKLIGITVVIVLALKIALSDGMLLERVGSWLEKKVDDGYKIFDLFVCPFCMGTLQTATAHLFAFGLGILPLEWNWQLIIRYPIIVFATSAIAGFTWSGYQTMNRIKEKNEIESEYYKSLFNNNENE